jgi:hypothetical protein
MITRCSLVLAAAVAGSLLLPAQAMGNDLKSVLLKPKNLGSGFASALPRTQGMLRPAFAHNEACGKAVRAFAGLYGTGVATGLTYQGPQEGFSEYLVRGGKGEITGLGRLADIVARSCRRITVMAGGTKDIIRPLRIGRVADETYGLKYRSGAPDSQLEWENPGAGLTLAIDVVVVRRGGTIMVLEHDGTAGHFHPGLTKSVAKAAAKRLRA